jgi:formylmethanofuran dehydrogenase subunit E
MKPILVAILLLPLPALAAEKQPAGHEALVRATLEVDTEKPDYLLLHITNVSAKTVRLLDPHEGTAWCGDFYQINVIKDGKTYQSKACLYAPAVPGPAVEKLAPGQTYDRRIQLIAYMEFMAAGKTPVPPYKISVTYCLTERGKRMWKGFADRADLDLTFQTAGIEIDTAQPKLKAADQLPQPHYRRQASDPAWLKYVVQIHGHLGPSVVAGARMGMIGLRAVEAKGYFDVEVTCEGPLAKTPQSCFLDGIQVATGATLGKRNLQWAQADQLAVRIKNTRTGKTAVLRPTPALMKLLGPFTPQSKAEVGHGIDDEQVEAIGRKIAIMPEREIASITIVEGTAKKGPSP